MPPNEDFRKTRAKTVTRSRHRPLPLVGLRLGPRSAAHTPHGRGAAPLRMPPHHKDERGGPPRRPRASRSHPPRDQPDTRPNANRSGGLGEAVRGANARHPENTCGRGGGANHGMDNAAARRQRPHRGLKTPRAVLADTNENAPHRWHTCRRRTPAVDHADRQTCDAAAGLGGSGSQPRRTPLARTAQQASTRAQGSAIGFPRKTGPHRQRTNTAKCCRCSQHCLYSIPNGRFVTPSADKAPA